MKHLIAIATLLVASPALALDVQLTGGWDGKTVPAGQHCTLQGGNGSTPPMTVSGIPGGATWLVLEFNDKDYRPLSTKGGHGILAYPVKGATTKIPALPGMTTKLPGGARVMKPSRAGGEFASPGYLPPCSNGRKNRYSVDVKAIDGAGKVLDKARNISIGRY